MAIAFASAQEGFTCPACHKFRPLTKHCEGKNCEWLKCKPCGIAMNPENRKTIRMVKE